MVWPLLNKNKACPTLDELTAKGESNYRMLFNGVADAIVIADFSTRVIDVNPAACKLFGYSKKEFLKLQVKNLHPQSQLPEVMKVFKRLTATGNTLSQAIEIKIIAKHKKVKFVSLNISRMKLDGRSCLIGLFRDITEKKEIETRYRTMAELAHDNIYLIDAQGRVLYVNEFGAKQFKAKPAEVIGKNIKELFPLNISKRQKTNIDKAFASGQPNYFENISYFPSGQVWLSTQLTPIKDEAGRVVSVMGLSRDISAQKITEKELNLRKDRLQEYLDVADVMLVAIGKNQKVTAINKKGCELLGYKEEEIIGRNWFDNFIPKRDRAATKKVFNSLIKGSSSRIVRFENNILSKTGQEKIISWHNKPIRDDQGEFIFSLSSGEDITESAKVKHALINNEARMRAIFEHSPIAIVLVGLDNKFISVNRAAVKFWGYSEKELKKLTFADITHPDEANRDLNQVKLLLKGKMPVYNVDKRYITKDKKVVYGRVSSVVMKNGGNKPLYFLTAIEDITEHKRWEEQIKQSEEKYSTLVENSNDAVILIQNGIIKYANPAVKNISGLAAKEIVGQSMLDFVAPQYRKLITLNYQRRMAGEKVDTRYEFAIIDNHGKAIPVENNSSVVTFEGRPADMAILRDISKAKEIDRLKSEFVSMSSHQLRTPLTGIKWFGELLLKEKVGKLTAEQKDFVQQIYSSNERMIHLVNDLLDVSHIETGRKFVLNKKPGDLRLALKRAIEDQSLAAKKKNISFVLDASCNSKLSCSFDFDKIVQMLNNLIGNAIKYSPNKTKITFGCKRQGDYWSMSVADQGYGIPAYQQHRMFERFFRADNIRGVAPEGTGLGLYIAKGIIEAHQGRIWFDTKENKGTTFYFTLPLRSAK